MPYSLVCLLENSWGGAIGKFFLLIDSRRMKSSDIYVLDSLSVGSRKPSLDLSKDDLYGDLLWLRDNDYVTRGYRACLSFFHVLARQESLMFVYS